MSGPISTGKLGARTESGVRGKSNAQLAQQLAAQKLAPFRALPDDELARIRALRSEQSARWRAVAPGDTLVVPFHAAQSALS